jgi:hypothetical protein
VAAEITASRSEVLLVSEIRILIVALQPQV